MVHKCCNPDIGLLNMNLMTFTTYCPSSDIKFLFSEEEEEEEEDDDDTIEAL
jgi:hypothetical protein